jgi:UDP-N-acetylglucosamine 2-epimerase (non-hydrolysing)
MSRISVLSVVGTRPEAIKMAPVIMELRKHPDRIRSTVCVTAQHREMLDQILSFFGIIPDFDLDVMEQRQSLGRLTANILGKMEPMLAEIEPDWILVQGDTTTVMAAALSGFYRKLKIAHVEAGLRSWNKYQPFPEEVNRKVVDSLADLHFAPTETARQNLLREGINRSTIHVTGNTVIDTLLGVLGTDYDWMSGPLADIPQDGRIIMITAHRRESYGKPITDICRALKTIAERYRGDVHLVYPVHLNPNIREPVYSMLEGIPNVSLIPPIDYLDLVNLMKRSYLVLTDSGGIQEEAPSLGKPVLVLRSVTERPEAVDAGTVKVVGTDSDGIESETVKLLEDRAEYARMAAAVNPYGDGHASERIVRLLLGELPEEFVYAK